MAQIDDIQPGQRVRVYQQIPQRDEVWSVTVEGVAVRREQEKTGSWFAHAKDDRLWLDRLVVRQDDGEIVWINLDAYTHIDVLGNDTGAPEAGDTTPAAESS